MLELKAIKGKVLGFEEVIKVSALQGEDVFPKSEKYKFVFQLLTRGVAMSFPTLA